MTDDSGWLNEWMNEWMNERMSVNECRVLTAKVLCPCLINIKILNFFSSSNFCVKPDFIYFRDFHCLFTWDWFCFWNVYSAGTLQYTLLAELIVSVAYSFLASVNRILLFALLLDLYFCFGMVQRFCLLFLICVPLRATIWVLESFFF